MWFLWKQQWQFNNGAEGGGADGYKYITNNVSVFPLSSHNDPWGNKNSAYMLTWIPVIVLYTSVSIVSGLGPVVRLSSCVFHTATDMEMKSVEKGLSSFFLYRRGKWLMSSAINHSDPRQLNSRANLAGKLEVSGGNDIKYKLSYVLITIFASSS